VNVREIEENWKMFEENVMRIKKNQKQSIKKIDETNIDFGLRFATVF
jgi:hypothetical protein